MDGCRVTIVDTCPSRKEKNGAGVFRIIREKQIFVKEFTALAAKYQYSVPRIESFMSTTPKPRILAVDDSRVMRRAMSKVLGKTCDVVEAEHGEDAWTLLINDPDIQVVFTDLSMPYLDGFGLLDRMRASDDPRLQELPVVIITGKEDDDETKQLALDKGASDFITKPFDSVQLQARAKAHLRFGETSRKLSRASEDTAIDELTGLGAHRYFLKVAEEQLAYARRHGGQFILLRLDVDDFNRLFIHVGKEQANQILKGVGETLCRAVRKEDTVARVGLAKFAMLLREATMEEATETARRILEQIAKLTFSIDGKKVRVTSSIGLLEPHVDEAASIEAILQEAEKYLAKAAKAGGNQVAAKSLRKFPSDKKVSLQTALRLLEFGHGETIKPHIGNIVAQLLPLLDFLIENADDNTAATLKQYQDKLGA
ncbi:MAG TPA: diguanylate cyclase [Chromatiales bacterium]|nr:diguanylate cyclase [Chromatiales bacterium]